MDYKQELFAQRTPYLQWLKCRDAAFDREDALDGISVFPFCSCTDGVKKLIGGKADKERNYLFAHEDGVLHDGARKLIAKAFVEHDEALVVYADEDYFGTLEELYHVKESMFDDKITSAFKNPANALFRGEPWFKPEFSPDTLESFFYIGNVFAVNGRAMAEILDGADGDIPLCVLIRELSRKASSSNDINHGENIFVHIPEALYTNNRLSKKDELDGFAQEQTDIIKIGGARAKLGRLSVIIPSKDNPDLLKRCIEAFVQCAKDIEIKYELIIVDNGSLNDNSRYISAFLDDCNARYIYEKMEFNFSRMCNIGAKASSGDFLLFLNDDIEAGITGVWIEKMMRYAAFSHVGAVGVKLCYPADGKDNDSYTIQHAGITNMGIGPAHKLGGMRDEGNMYHGHNIADYNMLAVTAACMMISREKFERAGGFDEELAVAYNDVELCFRLYKKGFYNVQVNSEFLFHHESLSRGHDVSEEKQERLLKEKQKLYEKHPWAMGGYDPFYSPNFVQWEKDVEYNICYQYEYDKIVELKEVAEDKKRMLFKKEDLRRRIEKKSAFLGKLYNKLTGADRDMLNIDSIEREDSTSASTRVTIKITGWHVLRKSDNADLEKRLWIFEKTSPARLPQRVYEAELFGKMRPDVGKLFADEEKNTKNVELSGICLKFDASRLKKGEYSIGVVAGRGGKKRLAVSEKLVEIY